MSEMPKMKVAITGNIGSGKSTVLTYLKSLGYPVISADEVNKQLLTDNSVKNRINQLMEINNAIKTGTKVGTNKKIDNSS